jgi:hypothetical protein
MKNFSLEIGAALFFVALLSAHYLRGQFRPFMSVDNNISEVSVIEGPFKYAKMKWSAVGIRCIHFCIR